MEADPLTTLDCTPFIECAHILVEHDEALRALQLLDNLPAYYRDHPPRAVSDLRRLISAKLYTPADYAKNPHDAVRSLAWGKQVIEGTVRGILIGQVVSQFNKQDVVPHIVDYGPGEYWLPLGLKELGYRFTYRDIGLHNEAHKQAVEILGDHYSEKDQGPVIFVATEIIEHLKDETEIRQSFDRVKVLPDYVFCSTPKYTFQIQKKWQEDGIGHLRAYTPREFQVKVAAMFPEYTWQCHEEQLLTMIGTRGTIGK